MKYEKSNIYRVATIYYCTSVSESDCVSQHLIPTRLNMADLFQQRYYVNAIKRETLLNVGLLSKVHPMSSDMSRLLKENTLEKPTQDLFYHLTYFLVSVINPNASLPWPLSQSEDHKTYKNMLSRFISDYSNKGLLSPVVSSYLVNPGCYKVTVLLYEMSQLAVNRVLLKLMVNDDRKKVYENMTEKYEFECDETFTESVEHETAIVENKFSKYLVMKEVTETIAEMLCDRLTKMEHKMKALKPEEFIVNCIDGYMEKHPHLDESAKKEYLEIKDVNIPAGIYDKWLQELDQEIAEMESNYISKMGPLLVTARETFQNSETLIARKTGVADKRTFMLEFNTKADNINTEELEIQVNTQQKYILKNIVQDDKLNFPNLIRGFLISISFILQNMEIGNDVYQFNQCLCGGTENYEELLNGMRMLLERVVDAEGRLKQQHNQLSSPISLMDVTEIIPPPKDLSDIKIPNEFHLQVQFDAFTPLNFAKRQSNLRKHKSGLAMKQMPKLLATPFCHQLPYRDNFYKSLTSCRKSVYDMNITQNTTIQNFSITSHATSRANLTSAGSTTCFTKEQLNKLLSTKKSSIKKKKFKHERSNLNIIKGGLFNESGVSIESMVRCHSSPNLNENPSQWSRRNFRSRKLSVMNEDSPTSFSEMSGIVPLGKDSHHSTPQEILPLNSSKKLEAFSLPSISNIESDMSTLSNVEVNLNKEIEFKEPQIILPKRKSKEMAETQTVGSQRKSTENVNKVKEGSQGKSTENVNKVKECTPKMDPSCMKKPNSLEKILNRYKNVRARSLLPAEPKQENKECKTIFEGKENFNTVNMDAFRANRNILPDLLSPSCSFYAVKNINLDEPLYYDSDEGKSRRPRESLGTALGVDHTFLDQFDLIDE